MQAFGGTEHNPPIVAGNFFEQQKFDGAAGVIFDAAQARWEDFGIVENEEVPGLEEVRKIGEFLMGNGSGWALED